MAGRPGRKGPLPKLPPHLEELILLLEAQDLTALDRAGAISSVRKNYPEVRFSWADAVEHETFADRWEALQELRTLALEDKETAAGIAGTRSAGTVLRRAGRDGNNGSVVLTRDSRGLVEKHRRNW